MKIFTNENGYAILDRPWRGIVDGDEFNYKAFRAYPLFRGLKGLNTLLNGQRLVLLGPYRVLNLDLNWTTCVDCGQVSSRPGLVCQSYLSPMIHRSYKIRDGWFSVDGRDYYIGRQAPEAAAMKLHEQKRIFRINDRWWTRLGEQVEGLGVARQRLETVTLLYWEMNL